MSGRHTVMLPHIGGELSTHLGSNAPVQVSPITEALIIDVIRHIRFPTDIGEFKLR
jgi:hypothetical protein